MSKKSKKNSSRNAATVPPNIDTPHWTDFICSKEADGSNTELGITVSVVSEETAAACFPEFTEDMKGGVCENELTGTHKLVWLRIDSIGEAIELDSDCKEALRWAAEYWESSVAMITIRNEEVVSDFKDILGKAVVAFSGYVDAFRHMSPLADCKIYFMDE